MKKLYYLLLVALPLLFATSCDDDGNDLPNVDFIVDIDNGVYKEGKIYVVAGETLEVTGVKVINLDQGKGALLSYVDYSWDYMHVAQSLTAPFGCDIYISPETEPGQHVLQLYAPVYAVDKAPAYAVLEYPVVVVSNASELPTDGNTSFTDNPKISASDPSK